MIRYPRSRFSALTIVVSVLLTVVGFLVLSTDVQAQTTTSTLKNLVNSIAEKSTSNLKVSFTYTPRYPIEGQIVKFAEVSTGNPVSWQWDFGDGTTSTERNPVHIYSSPGFLKITLAATTGAISKKTTKTLIVMPSTSPATFIYTPTTPALGQTVQFADTTPGDPTSWRWNFGDGTTSTLKNPSHAYFKEGSHVVSLTAQTSSGSKQGSKTITIASMSVLASSFNFSPISPSVNQSVQFTDISTGSPTSWLWNFGDGTTSTSQNPSHAYTTAGSKTVTLTVASSSGSNTTARTLTVATALAASFIFSPAAPAAGQSVQFTDTSTGSPTSWSWNFNDGATNTVQNPNHIFTAAGSYAVILTVNNSSGSSISTRTINVAPSSSLIASFSYSPISPVARQAVQFTDTSTGNPSMWQWDFGDGSTSNIQNPIHSYSIDGSRTVTLTVSNNTAADTSGRNITIISDDGTIPSERIIDWSQAGVWHNSNDRSKPWLGTKGIPNYPVGISISNTPGGTYFCDPTGATDCSTNLQAAINACAAGYAVYLPPGTYRVGSTVTIPSYKAIRGAGAWLTIINSSCSGYAFTMNGPGYNQTGYPVASGYAAGSNQVVMSGPHPFTVGSIATIDQLNTGDIYNPGNCSWCGRDSGSRSMRQARIVTAVNGNTITFHKPLYWGYEAGNSPQICRDVTSPVINAGIEDLTIETNGGSSSSGIWAYGNMFSWIKGVRITNIAAFGIKTHAGAIGLEIRRCYIDHSTVFTTSHGYGIHFLYGATDCLVEDNIFKHNHIHISIEAGGTGNVIGYNYMETTQDISSDWFQCSIMFYGAHSYKNLMEGNVFGKINPSDYFGSTSHQTVYRNHITRQNPDHAVSQVLTAVIVDEWAYSYSFIGNVLGYPGMTGNYEVEYVPTSENYSLVWKRGYHTNAIGSPTDLKVASTMIRHGNYSYLDNSTRWINGKPQTLEPSLYYRGKPSWWGDYLWPAIGPDVNGYVSDFPAKKRWADYLIARNLQDLF